MKQLLFASILLSAVFVQAKTYNCIGLDNKSLIQVELSNDVKLIGTLNGAQVQLSEYNNDFISLSIKQGKLVTVVSGRSGNISFHQNDGKKASSVQCVE